MNVFQVFDVAIGIEKRLSNMYYKFSSLFKDNTEIYHFWIGLANHEKIHAETLILSKGYMQWNHPSLIHKDVPIVHVYDIKELESLDSITKGYERKIRKDRISLQDTLGLLLTIENSELNHLYNRFIHLSGVKLSQKPESAHKTIYEHMKIIKSFIDKHYRGNLPPIRLEDYKEARHVTTASQAQESTMPVISAASSKSDNIETVKGKIIEVVPDMNYGFIEGDDGRRYMFLPDDISDGKFESVMVNDKVEFSVMLLPWGPRATGVNIKK